MEMFKRRRPVTVGVVIAVIATGLAMFAYSQAGAVQIVTTTNVEQSDLSNSTFVFGRAANEEVFELAFDIAGRLTIYPFSEGDVITKGMVVAKLDTTSISGDIGEAQSVVDVERARLNELGSDSPENDKNLQSSKIAQSEAELDALYLDLENLIASTYVQIRDNFSKYIDIYYGNLDKPNPYVQIPGFNMTFTKETTLRSSRQAVQNIVTKYQSGSPDEDGYEETKSDLSALISFLNSYQQIIESSSDQTVIGNASLALNAMVDLRQAIIARKNTIITVEQNLLVAKQQLQNLQEVGAKAETLDFQQSIVSSKQASVDALFADLSKYTLRSPVDGVVFNAPLSNFASVVAGSEIISIVENKDLQVNADVAESDIAFIGIGNRVEVTFDAIPEEIFVATVSEIENRENIGQTVPTYRTSFTFVAGQDLDKIRSGMTANIIVYSGERKNVLHVLSNFIMSDSDGAFVYKVSAEDNKKVEKTYVQLGLKTNDGRTEIVSGLSGSDRIAQVK